LSWILDEKYSNSARIIFGGRRRRGKFEREDWKKP